MTEIDARPTVVCVGVFDGVHLGHQALVRECRAIAGADGTVIAATFDPHPGGVLRPEGAPASLATLRDRILLLESAGADAVEVLRFTPAFAGMSPRAFATLLRDDLGATTVVVGENFRFGVRASGDAALLRELGADLGFAVRTLLIEDAGGRISSTRIRHLVSEGEVEAAAGLLGRPYRMRGIVVHGDARGRELGYPTANLAWDTMSAVPVIPANGVYAGWVIHRDEAWPAAISVGTNPQFRGTEQRVEAYVLDREGLDLYGARIGVDFTARIRGQEVFATVDDLLVAMATDVERARTLVGGAPPGW